MDFKQLEIFAAVVKYKSFTKAAEALFLTQPTISSHIQALESELDAQLIIRTTKSVHPSKVGQTLYSYTVQLLALRDKAVDAVRGFETEMNGEIAIGASSIPATYFLPPMMGEFSQKNARASFSVVSGDSAFIVEQLLLQKIEIGIVGTVIPTKKCAFDLFANDKLVIITPNTPQFAALKKTENAVRALLQQPFISREAGSGTRRETEYLIRELGFDVGRLNTVAEMTDNESIVRAVAQGLGVSVISDCAAADYRQFGKILTFTLGSAQRPRKLYLVRNNQVPLSPIAKAFYDFAVKRYLNK